MGLFRRKKDDDHSVEALLAEANAVSPTGRFRMPVEDVFSITGRGTVVTGRVESGVGTVGMTVQILRDGVEFTSTTVTAIEKFRAVIDTAQAGENVGLLLRGITREQLHTGDVIQG